MRIGKTVTLERRKLRVVVRVLERTFFVNLNVNLIFSIILSTRCSVSNHLRQRIVPTISTTGHRWYFAYLRCPSSNIRIPSGSGIPLFPPAWSLPRLSSHHDDTRAGFALGSMLKPVPPSASTGLSFDIVIAGLRMQGVNYDRWTQRETAPAMHVWPILTNCTGEVLWDIGDLHRNQAR